MLSFLKEFLFVTSSEPTKQLKFCQIGRNGVKQDMDKIIRWQTPDWLRLFTEKLKCFQRARIFTVWQA